MAAIALFLTLVALAVVYFGMEALAARIPSRAVACFSLGGILFIVAIIVTIAGHALVL